MIRIKMPHAEFKCMHTFLRMYSTTQTTTPVMEVSTHASTETMM